MRLLVVIATLAAAIPAGEAYASRHDPIRGPVNDIGGLEYLRPYVIHASRSRVMITDKLTLRAMSISDVSGREIVTLMLRNGDSSVKVLQQAIPGASIRTSIHAKRKVTSGKVFRVDGVFASSSAQAIMYGNPVILYAKAGRQQFQQVAYTLTGFKGGWSFALRLRAKQRTRVQFEAEILTAATITSRIVGTTATH
jgi:hypothetical protein